MGKLIVIEGLDGSGKSTQVEMLKARLLKENKNIKQIKLPNYESNSCALVKMYLGGEFGNKPEDVNAYAASTFYAVDRFASFKQIWQEDYNNSETIILADRYTTSNAVHQMVKLDKSEWEQYLLWLEDFEYKKLMIPKPDRVIFLDMPVDVSQKLMTKRYNGDEVKKDVHESNVEYLKKCRKAVDYAAEKLGWIMIKCAENGEPLPFEEISEMIYKEIF
ncbi:MAG: deoxynucleoside kinase [Clostridiales bacterium]|nr:deoxynucleoside kinase [Clostridiales bacterium]